MTEEETCEPRELVLIVPIKCTTLKSIGERLSNATLHTIVGVSLALYTFFVGLVFAFPSFMLTYALLHMEVVSSLAGDSNPWPLFLILVMVTVLLWLCALVMVNEILTHYKINIRIDCIREKPKGTKQDDTP